MTTEFAPETNRLEDKRIVGERRRAALLNYLHRFSWLTGRMIAELLWPESQYAQAMARRLIRSMLEDQLILRRELPGTGVDCFTLSAAGAKLLSSTTGLTARSGASIPLGNVIHRACSNWYLISHINQGTPVWAEHEVQSGRCPVKMVDSKVPDGLVETPFGLLWLEVENAWKARQSRSRIKTFCVSHLSRNTQLSLLAPELHLLRVVIVGTSTSAIDAVVRTLAEAHAEGELSDSQAGEVDLVLLPVDKSLNPGSMVVENLFWDRLS